MELAALAAVDRDLARYTFAGAASVYPFAWSILLAARAEGLGGVLTTMAIREEADVLDALGAPEGFAMAALLVSATRYVRSPACGAPRWRSSPRWTASTVPRWADPHRSTYGTNDPGHAVRRRSGEGTGRTMRS